MNLKGKVALITGGARIGVTVGEELAKRGCDVIFAYRRSRRAAEKGVVLVEAQGRIAGLIQADVTKERDVIRLFQKIKKKFGQLDVLVNMASIYEATPWDKLNEKTWGTLVDANAKSTYLTVLHASRMFSQKAGARVINFSDWVAGSGRPRYKGFVPYYAAKSAVIGLTQAQALDLAPNVLVNAIAPGPILPPTNLKNEETRAVQKVTPLGKWGGALEIAKAVLFLIETDFVTGECLRVDGGRHLY